MRSLLPVHWPLPKELWACFEREQLDSAPHEDPTPYAFGYLARDHRKRWSRVEPVGWPLYDHELLADRIEGAVVSCAREGDSFQGRVRMFLRADDDGSVVVWANPLDPAVDRPDLLCCLREAQSHIATAAFSEPGSAAVRFDVAFGPERVYVSEPRELYDGLREDNAIGQ